MTERTTRAIDLAYKAHAIARVVGNLHLNGVCNHQDRVVRIESHVWRRNVKVYQRRYWGLRERLVLDVRIQPGDWLVRTFIDGKWAEHIERYVTPEERVNDYGGQAPALRLVPA